MPPAPMAERRFVGAKARARRPRHESSLILATEPLTAKEKPVIRSHRKCPAHREGVLKRRRRLHSIMNDGTMFSFTGECGTCRVKPCKFPDKMGWFLEKRTRATPQPARISRKHARGHSALARVAWCSSKPGDEAHSPRHWRRAAAAKSEFRACPGHR